MADRGVSDVLGYALVFALIVSMVGVVYTSGLGGLHNVRESEKLTNAERAFDVLDSNIDDIASGTGQSRGTEIKLENAEVGFGQDVVVNVSVDGGSYYSGVLTPIYFAGQNRDTKIISVDGAVLRSETDGATMLSDPGFVFGDTTVVPMLITRTRETGVSGSGRVLVRTVSPERRVVHLPAQGSDVTINVTTPRTGAWSDYLSEQTGQPCSVSGQTVTCQVTTDDVYVQVIWIDVALN